MRLRHFHVASAALAGALLLGCASSHPAPPEADEEAIASTVLGLTEAYLDAWESLDKDRILSFHSDDIRYYWLGKGTISSNSDFARLLDQILPGIKSWSVQVKDQHVEVLGRDAAVVSFLTQAGASTYVFERRDGQWKIINIHESEPIPAARSSDATQPGNAVSEPDRAGGS